MNELQLSKALDRASMLGDKDTVKAILDQKKNPDQYTTNAPNTGSKAVFSTQNFKGAGRDGLKRGEDTFYYKVEKPEEKSSSTPAPERKPAPKPNDDMVIKQRPDKRQEAKERTTNYQTMTNDYGENPEAQKNFAQAETLDLSKYQFNAN